MGTSYQYQPQDSARITVSSFSEVYPGMLVLKAPMVSYTHDDIKNPWKVVSESLMKSLGKKTGIPQGRWNSASRPPSHLNCNINSYLVTSLLSQAFINFILLAGLSAFGLLFTSKCDCEKQMKDSI